MTQCHRERDTSSLRAAKRKLSRARYFRAVQQVLTAIPGSLSRVIRQLLDEGSHESILSISVSPDDYSDPWQFRQDYFAVRFLQKCPYLDTGIDTRSVASQKFWEAESECGRTNERIRGLYRTVNGEASLPLRVRQIHDAREKIRSILGRFDAIEWESKMRFGPGASTSTKGDWTNNYRKLQSIPDCTASFRPFSKIILRDNRLWSLACGTSEPRVIRGNKVDFVPKNAKTDRAIAIEPILNGYAQLGLGSMIRRRLLKVGIDLNDQSLNQSCAYHGSLHFDRPINWRTIDLASASDTISYCLVKELLPDDWFHAMDLCRSEEFLLEGAYYKYNKFSSMGNGYTFELESLIFCALISAIGISDADRCVYGDDLAVYSSFQKVEELISLLSFCGFAVNTEKSCLSGPFRESCGKDYFKGVLCTPFYAREGMMGNPYFLHNSLLRWQSHHNSELFSSLLVEMREHVPVDARYYIPDGYGDGGFVITNLCDILRGSAECPKGILPVRNKGQVEGWSVRHLVERPIRREMSSYYAAVGAMLLSVVGASYPEDGHLGRPLREPVFSFGYETARRKTVTKVGLLEFRLEEV